ncbi:glycine oxidase ThiO [Nesterenkonia flava]|uniref:glycine oxidase n=1 Tax=Nesterenkonia flava TaxID=469799 RepID=A0ABU1FVW3_9MICC|nr:glycine oxidase ThiO [Nesterenkonia flava]MDR5712820.1 glycine oxidase ThiO [Nesterenkonia flava]
MRQSRQVRTAVVGAGVVGLLTAWQLRITGHTVTIFDPAPGSQASYAAAGMLAPISEVQYGQQELWPLMTASRTEYPAFLRNLSRAVDEPTGYRDNGTVLLAADAGDRAAVAEMVSVQQAHGMHVAPLTSSQLRSREPGLAPRLAKAWDVPDDHQVDPRQLVRCVSAALDASLSEQDFPDAGPPARWVPAEVTRVTAETSPRVEWEAGTESEAGAESFDHVVLVPGLGYSHIAGLPQERPLPLRPVHGDVIRLRVRPEQLGPGEPHVLTSTVRAKVGGRSVYLVPRADGGLVVGASSREDGLAQTHAGSVQELLEDAVAVLPAVRDMQLEEITTRARPGTPDDRPLLGALTDDAGVVVSTGYSRHGILLAPLAARLTAALINGASLNDDDTALLAAASPDR